MKKLFGFFGGANQPEQTKVNDNEAQPARRTSLLKSRYGRNNGKNNSNQVDMTQIMVNNAAAALADIIQEIVGDASSLKGENMTGYQILLEVLDDETILDDPNEVAQSHGFGAVVILMANLDHSKFTELCMSANLPTGLFQALRLLRMLEIKQAKATFEANEQQPVEGITKKASGRVCKILEKLCTSSAVVEQMRQSLVKIFTFPLSVLPIAGVHIQRQMAGVITSICRAGFSSQQVWFLHDVQCIHHMIRHLSEIALINADKDNTDFLLRGLNAEKHNMWLVGVQCVVDIISSTLHVGTVLLNDFESGGGNKLFVHILTNSSPERFLQMLNIITTMLFDPKKKQESIVYPVAASVLASFLTDLLNSQTIIQSNDYIDKYMQFSYALSENRDVLEHREYVIQGMAYCLLTLYSNEPIGCINLEESFHFLPTLILCIPSLRQTEPISAVLTTVNYVCQCVETTSRAPITALSAASATLLSHLFDKEYRPDEREQIIHQIDLVFSSIEAIARSNPKYALTFLTCGLLQMVVCDTFLRLLEELKMGEQFDESLLGSYEKVIHLLLELNTKTSNAPEEIQKSGVVGILRQVMKQTQIPPHFFTTMIKVFEELARVDDKHLVDSISSILKLTIDLKTDYVKVSLIFDSLWKILLDSEASIHLFIQERSIEYAFDSLKTLDQVFVNGSEDSMCTAFELSTSTLRYLSLLLYYDGSNALYRETYGSIAELILDTGIFTNKNYREKGIELVFNFITLFSTNFGSFHQGSLHLLAGILPELNHQTFHLLIKYTTDFLQGSPDRSKIIGESSLIPVILRGMEENGIDLLDRMQFVDKVIQKSWTIEIAVDVLRCVINRAHLLRRSDNAKTSDHTAIELLKDEMSTNSYQSTELSSVLNSMFHNVSIVKLPIWTASQQMLDSNSLAVFFSENINPLPTNILTICCWFRLTDYFSTAGAPVYIPIIFIESAGSDVNLMIEINSTSNEAIITYFSSDGKAEEVLIFKPGFQIQVSEWTHLVVTIKRIKRFASNSQAAISLMLNGIAWSPVASNILINDPFASNNSGEIRVGYGRPKSLSAHNTSAANLNMSSLSVYTEPLTSKQVAFLFFAGPSFVGHVHSDSPLTESFSAFSTRSLRIANQTSKNAVLYLEKVSMNGLENIVEHKIESHPVAISSFELPTLPTPSAIINAKFAVAEKASLLCVSRVSSNNRTIFYTECRPELISMVNVVDLENSTPIATLRGIGYLDHCSSLTECIAALGGVDVLLPLLQNVREEKVLKAILESIQSITSNSLMNIKQMQSYGFKTLGFALNLLPRSVITVEVVKELLGMAIATSTSNLKSSSHSSLLVDCSAMMNLIYNHNVWDVSKFSIIKLVLQTLKHLVLDEKYSATNCMRLSCLGIGRWVLYLCLYVIECSHPISAENTQDQWYYKPRSAFEMADYRDELEEFLATGMTVVQHVLGSTLRVRDLELIVNIILYTSIPSVVNQSSNQMYRNYQDEKDTDNSPVETFSTERVSITKDQEGDTNVIPTIIESPQHPFCTYHRKRVGSVDSIRGETRGEDCYHSDDQQNHQRFLSPIDFLRIYLLRLLFAIYDDNLEDLRRQAKRTPTARNNNSNNSNGQGTPFMSEMEAFQSFRQACSPTWFLGIIERAEDVATKSHALRLLGLLLQKDAIFCKEFCAMKGHLVLYNSLCFKAQEIPVVLPLISMLFRIPMQLLMHPAQIKSVAKVAQLLDLDECSGPILTEPLLTEQCLPMLNIYYDCLVNAARADRELVPWASAVQDLLVGVLEYAMENCHAFKQLMQHPVAIEIHITALMSLSNAYIEYGSQIYDNDDGGSIDLTNTIREDYIRNSYTRSSGSMNKPHLSDLRYDRGNTPVRFMDSMIVSDRGSPQDFTSGQGSFPQYATEDHHELRQQELRFTYPAFNNLQHLTASILRNAVKENEDGNSYNTRQGLKDTEIAKCLHTMMISYTDVFSNAYRQGYQTLIANLFRQVAAELTLQSLDYYTLANIGRNIAHLFPLIKAGYLFSGTVFEFLRTSCELLERCLQSHDSVNPPTDIIKDLGNNSRFLAIYCLQLIHHHPLEGANMLSRSDSSMRVNELNPSDSSNAAANGISSINKLQVLSLVLKYIGKLLHPALDDNIEVLNTISAATAGGMSSSSGVSGGRFGARAASTDLTEKSSIAPAQVLDALQGLTSAGAQRRGYPHGGIAQIKSDRNRIASIFCMYLANYMYNLVLEEDSAVRIEATRILAYLANHRRYLMEQLVGSNSSNSATGASGSTSTGSNSNATSAGVVTSNSIGGGISGSSGGSTRLWRNNSTSGTAHSENDFEPYQVDIFRDGLAKLVPDASGQYDIYRRGGTDSNESEESRFADFSFWISDNNVKCDKVFRVVENCVNVILPNVLQESEELEKYLKNSIPRARDLWIIDYAESVKAAMFRAETAQRLGEKIHRMQFLWKREGYRDLAVGVLHWKKIITALKTGPIWGNNITSSLSASLQNHDRQYERRHRRRRSTEEVQSQPSILAPTVLEDRVIYKLIYSEGPERVRRKLVRDFSNIYPQLFGAEKVKTPVRHDPEVEAMIRMEQQRVLAASTTAMTETAPDDITMSATTIPAATNTGSSNQPEDIGELLKMMTKQGVILRHHQEDENNEENTLNDQEMISYEEITAQLNNNENLQTTAENLQEDEGNEQEQDTTLLEEIDEMNIIESTKNDGFARTSVINATDIEDAILNFHIENTNEESEKISHRNSIKGIDQSIIHRQDSSDQSSIFKMDREFSSNTDSGNTAAATAAATLTAGPNTAQMNSYSGNDQSGSYQKVQHDQNRPASMSFILKELLKGMIGMTELKSCSFYNVERILGLETQKTLLVLSEHYLHLIGGIVAQDPKKNINEIFVEWSSISTKQQKDHQRLMQELRRRHNSSYNLQSNNDRNSHKLDDVESILISAALERSEQEWIYHIWQEILECETYYTKIHIEEIYTFFKRRHLLKYTGLEIADTKGEVVLFACDSVESCNEILTALLERDLPSSIFNKTLGLKNLQLMRGANNMYQRLVSIFLSSITQLWQHGEITNFEYLMFVNSAAGRSYLDLTQYPVFPWILADYKSEVLDLDDISIYRDLSKPMGAIGAKRQQQYLERYQTMDEFYREGVEGASPPFHYGTHYSCAGYVLHYLIRLQPYANMSLALQGGAFDKADRLFSNIESSWLSASQENLQDVRELIPEFFYLPDFLSNVNAFDLGITQKDEVVNDVTLPRWAQGDPKQFIKVHRQALESKYVSENLHQWIDLIFGFKQRGKAAIEHMNVFIHITYENEVDLDELDDPVLVTATLAQINNFGQTPSKIFHKQHPRKIVPEVVKRLNDSLVLIEPMALAWHQHLSPPLCVVGASQFVFLNRVSYQQVSYYGNAKGLPVGDVRLISRDKIVASPAGTALLPPSLRRILRYRQMVDGFSLLTTHTFVGTRSMESEKEVSYHEHLHLRRLTTVSISRDGKLIATGSEDCSVRVWQILVANTSTHRRRLVHLCTFAGHEQAITTVDICPELNIVVSGGEDHHVAIWDYSNHCMLRMLRNHTGPILSVSVNKLAGYIAVLTADELRLYNISGELISMENFLQTPLESRLSRGRVVIAPPCGEWQDGVVAVTGHEDGNLYLWKLTNHLFNSHGLLPQQYSQTNNLNSDISNRNVRVRQGLLKKKSNHSLQQQSGAGSPSRKHDSLSSTNTSSTVEDLSLQQQLLFASVPDDLDSVDDSSVSSEQFSQASHPMGVQYGHGSAQLLPTLHYKKPMRRLYVACTPLRTHKAEITCLRLCPGNPNKARDWIHKAYEDSRGLELLVGDADGFVSRWSPMKLDQLSQTDLQSLTLNMR